MYCSPVSGLLFPFSLLLSFNLQSKFVNHHSIFFSYELLEIGYWILVILTLASSLFSRFRSPFSLLLSSNLQSKFVNHHSIFFGYEPRTLSYELVCLSNCQNVFYGAGFVCFVLPDCLNFLLDKKVRKNQGWQSFSKKTTDCEIAQHQLLLVPRRQTVLLAGSFSFSLPLFSN